MNNGAPNTSLLNFLLELADDALISGHRLSEWCGHAPILEEDIALANIALDHIGRANALYQLAAGAVNDGRNADDLAFLRDATEFRNINLVELPRGDFAFTILRLLFTSLHSLLLFQRLQTAKLPELAGIAGRSVKESTYHVRHSSAWIERLGLGTEESQGRLIAARDELWPYTGELLEISTSYAELCSNGLVGECDSLPSAWLESLDEYFRKAEIEMPAVVSNTLQGRGRQGLHTEHLGHLLAEMQILQRSHPGASW